MKSRTVLAVIAAALVFGAIGYYYGKRDLTEEPFAAPATVAAVAVAAPTCRATATVAYKPGQNPPLTIQTGEPDKSIPVGYPKASPSDWGVCWELVVHGDDLDPFKNLKVELEGNLGRRDRPILTGDPNFKGNKGVRLRFDDEPVWSGAGYDEYRMKYFVRGRLRSTNQAIEADPDIVIQKPGGFR